MLSARIPIDIQNNLKGLHANFRLDTTALVIDAVQAVVDYVHLCGGHYVSPIKVVSNRPEDAAKSTPLPFSSAYFWGSEEANRLLAEFLEKQRQLIEQYDLKLSQATGIPIAGQGGPIAPVGHDAPPPSLSDITPEALAKLETQILEKELKRRKAKKSSSAA